MIELRLLGPGDADVLSRVAATVAAVSFSPRALFSQVVVPITSPVDGWILDGLDHREEVLSRRAAARYRLYA